MCQHAPALRGGREDEPAGQMQHLCRLCGNCGFNWPEALADDSSAPGKPHLVVVPGRSQS
jgi:hypothetical protein